MHAHTHACTHTHIHTRTCIHTHTHSLHSFPFPKCICLVLSRPQRDPNPCHDRDQPLKPPLRPPLLPSSLLSPSLYPLLVLGGRWEWVGIPELPLQKGDTPQSTSLPPPPGLARECGARQSTSRSLWWAPRGMWYHQIGWGSEGRQISKGKGSAAGPTRLVRHDTVISKSSLVRTRKNGVMTLLLLFPLGPYKSWNS